MHAYVCAVLMLCSPYSAVCYMLWYGVHVWLYIVVTATAKCDQVHPASPLYYNWVNTRAGEARYCRILVYSIMNSIIVSPPSVTMASTHTTQTMLIQCYSRMNTNTLMHMETDKHLPTNMHTHAYNDQNIQHIYTHTHMYMYWPAHVYIHTYIHMNTSRHTAANMCSHIHTFC